MLENNWIGSTSAATLKCMWDGGQVGLVIYTIHQIAFHLEHEIAKWSTNLGNFIITELLWSLVV